MDKEFATIEEQIAILKSRGLNIDNGIAGPILERENYYKLINGYKYLFLDGKNITTEQYLHGTDFKELYSLYIFDRNLRNAYMRYILEVENNVKSIIAYVFSKEYGHDNYLKTSNLDITDTINPLKTDLEKIGRVSSILVDIQKTITNNLKKGNPMISHYMLNYGYIPLWVLINSVNLGSISKFYSNMKDSDKNNVAREFGLRSKELVGFIRVLTIFRNACAHDERFYNLKSVNAAGKKNRIKSTVHHRRLNITKEKSGNYLCGTNDIFAVAIIFKLILKDESFNEFKEKVSKLITDLQTKIHTVTIDDVLNEMGFPLNWQDL